MRRFCRCRNGHVPPSKAEYYRNDMVTIEMVVSPRQKQSTIEMAVSPRSKAEYYRNGSVPPSKAGYYRNDNFSPGVKSRVLQFLTT